MPAAVEPTSDDGIVRTPNIYRRHGPYRPSPYSTGFEFGGVYLLRLGGQVRRYQYLGAEEDSKDGWAGSMRWVDRGPAGV